jgi:hypothetical protein
MPPSNIPNPLELIGRLISSKYKIEIVETKCEERGIFRAKIIILRCILSRIQPPNDNRGVKVKNFLSCLQFSCTQLRQEVKIALGNHVVIPVMKKTKINR